MKFSISRIQNLLERKMILAKADEILKGIAHGKTMEDIYKRYPGVEKEKLDYEYKLGKEIEFEHTEYPEISEKILIDHLWESPTYYTDLLKYVENKKDETINESSSFIEENEELNEEEEEVNPDDYERDNENSDKLHDILTHEECVELAKYIKLIHKKPIAEKLEHHNDNTSIEVHYFIGEIEQDIVIKRKKIILKKGFYSVEKFVDAIPKIEPRVFTGSYETAEECAETLLDILIDLENSSNNIDITIKQLDKEI